jgi:uncharacterized membrane protein YccF (DUF307 family)
LLDRLGFLDFLPPVFVLTALAAYDVIQLGSREAEREGALAPRSGRVLMYFGALLLVISALALLNDVSNVERRPDVFINFAVLLGLLGGGIPAYVRAVRQQPELFLGDQATDDAALALDRPGRVIRLAWTLAVGWWLSYVVVMLVFFLALSIVGLPWARRLVTRMPAFMALCGRGTTIDLESRMLLARPAPEQLSRGIRAFYFVTIGWWLSIFVTVFGYLLLLPVVTIPLAVRLLSRIGVATTLERVR